MKPAAALALLLLLLLLLLLASGCAGSRYAGRGLVLDIDLAARTVTVSHDPIPGAMAAMVMPFKVRNPALLDDVERGDRVAFRLVVGRRASYLDRLRRISAAPVDPAAWQSPVLGAIARIGEQVPEFALTDHNDRRLSLSSLRGAVVAVNFIYTRCPLPDYCPRMTANFAALARRFAARLGKDLVLLSVTLDPQWDTPEILAGYARRHGAGAPGWHLLTGDKREITRVCGSFGIEFWPDDGSITHNLMTGVVDRSGRLAASVEGREYSAVQLGDLVERLLGLGPQ